MVAVSKELYQAILNIDLEVFTKCSQIWIRTTIGTNQSLATNNRK